MHSCSDMMEAARDKVRQFIGAGSTGEIIFTRGTTESMNLLASSFAQAFLKEGDEVIISGMEHHSNIVPWQIQAGRYGFKLRIIPVTHIGRNTKSTVISKGISAGHSQNSYRGLIKVGEHADGARNYSQCDSLLLGSDCGAHTFPYMDVKNETAIVEHEATTSKISEDQLFYCNQRGIPMEQAIGLIVNGYAKEVLNKLPMEFAVEAQRLLSVSLENTVG